MFKSNTINLCFRYINAIRNDLEYTKCFDAVYESNFMSCDIFEMKNPVSRVK